MNEKQVKIKALALAAKSVKPTAGVSMVTGHELSIPNQCLAIVQLPTVSVLGGFKQWLAAGRCVRKGEKALIIRGKAFRKDESGDAVDAYFPIVNVFDVSQTEVV
jgi:hypothetical protein